MPEAEGFKSREDRRNFEMGLEGEERINYFLNRGAPPPDAFEDHPGRPFLLLDVELKQWLMGEGELRLDIGAGMGRFLMAEAEKHPEVKYLGIDPDYQCVKKNLEKLANRDRRGMGLEKVRFFFGAAKHFLERCPEGIVDVAYVNYPDPWFKKKHHKRRLVTTEFLHALRPCLKAQGQVFVQTDIDDYAAFVEESLQELKGYRIQRGAEALFEGLAGTLYQEKAATKGHGRHCYHLTRLD